jgi:MFS transporter, DHA1 family, tetracycline resistance protein
VNRARLTSVLIVVFVDLLGFSLILPLLPYYAESYQASAALVGLLVASYAAAQFIGAPILGRLSDRYGRRPILLLSIAGTFVGFLLLGFVEPIGRALASLLASLTGVELSAALINTCILAVMFFSRILDGLTGGNISVAQAYITDVTDESNRAQGLGLIGAAFGLGFIIGPAIGGILSRYGFAVPAFAAAGLSLINLIAIWLFLPESLTLEKRAVTQGRPARGFSFSALSGALQRPRVGPLLHIRLFYALASGTFQSIFSLYALAKLGLNAQATAFVLAYVGILIVLVQGVLVGRLTKRYSESRLIVACSALLAVSLLGWALTPSLPVLLLVLVPMSVATGLMNTVINSALTKVVYPEEIGGALGLSASLESLSRILAPLMGGLLLQQLGPAAPGIVTALIMVWVVSFAWRRLIVNPDPPLPKRGAPAGHPAPREANMDGAIG